MDLLENDLYNIEQSLSSTKISGTRRHQSCIIKGIPDKTTEKELYGLLTQLVPGISIKSVRIHRPDQPKQLKSGEAHYCLQGFTYFHNDEDCKKVVNFFQDYTMSNIGFEITNKEQISGHIFVHFMYTKEGCNFYLQKMLKLGKHDIITLPKRDYTVLFYRVPMDATKNELVTFLKKEIPNMSGDIKDVKFLQGSALSYKKALVTLLSNEDREIIIRFFKFYNECGIGYHLRPHNPDSLGMFASYYFLKVDPDNSRNRIKNQIALYNVPKDTTSDELEEVLGKACSSPMQSVYKWKKNFTNDKYTVLVSFKSDAECEKIVRYFKLNDGYAFTNKVGRTSTIFANYCYKKPESTDFEGLCHRLQNYYPPANRCKKQICIYNIPEDIRDDEIELFLLTINPNAVVENIHLDFHAAAWSKAYVTLADDAVCWKIVDFFVPFILSYSGFQLESLSGKTSKVIIHHVYSFESQHGFQNIRHIKDATLTSEISWEEKKRQDKNPISKRLAVHSPDMLRKKMNHISCLLASYATLDTQDILVSNIPVDTMSDELPLLINSIKPLERVKFYSVSFAQKKSENMLVIYALLEMLCSDDCQKVVRYFMANHSTGYHFKNRKGNSGTLQMAFNQEDRFMSVKSLGGMCFNEVLIHGIPRETSQNELKSFLKDLLPGIEISKISFCSYNRGLNAFLKVGSSDRESLIHYFQSLPKERRSFTNEKGYEGELDVKYCFTEKMFLDNEEVPKEKLEKSDNKFVVYNIPQNTSAEELEKHVKNIAAVSHIDVFINRAKSPSTAFVWTRQNEKCISELIESINNQRLFRNANGDKGELTATFFYRPSKKSNVKLKIQNIPPGTTVEEISMLIKTILPSIVSVIKSVHIYNPCKIDCENISNGKEPCLVGLVEMLSPHDCEEVLKYFKQFNDGYSFSNKNGCTGKVFVEPYYISDKKGTEPNLQVVLHNLPPKTTRFDLITFFGDRIVSLGVFNGVWILVSSKKKKLSAILNLRNSADLDRFFWWVYRNNLVNGFKFTNTAGNVGVITMSCSLPMPKIFFEVADPCEQKLTIRGDEVVLSNVPDLTSEDEIVRLIVENIGDVCTVSAVRTFESKQRRNVIVNGEVITWRRKMFFLRLDSSQDCHAVYRFFKSFPIGFWFCNEKGLSSHLVVDYVYKDFTNAVCGQRKENLALYVVAVPAMCRQEKGNVAPTNALVETIETQLMAKTNSVPNIDVKLLDHIKALVNDKRSQHV